MHLEVWENTLTMDKFDVHIVKVILASLSTFFKIFQECFKSERTHGELQKIKCRSCLLLFTLLPFCILEPIYHFLWSRSCKNSTEQFSLLCWRLLFRKRLLKQKFARECDQVNAIDIRDRTPMISASACIYLYLGTLPTNSWLNKPQSDPPRSSQ